MNEYARQQPELFALLQDIRGAIGTGQYEATLHKTWPHIPRLSIDYAVMEDAEHMAVIPVDMGWSDIGSWKTLYDVLDHDKNANVTRGQGRDHILSETTGTFVYSDKRVVTIGIEDLVIVDTDDVLFVCHRDRAEDLRKSGASSNPSLRDCTKPSTSRLRKWTCMTCGSRRHWA